MGEQYHCLINLTVKQEPPRSKFSFLPLTPNFYNEMINNLQFHQLTCPCGHSSYLSVHGYYHRHIKASSCRLLFRICRVKCVSRGHTHAILLSFMIPHSQISLAEQAAIIHNYENSLSQDSVMNDNPSIDESCYHYIIRQYLNHWKQKLISECIPFSSIHGLTASCFSLFSCQFMLIKRMPNILFLNTT